MTNGDNNPIGTATDKIQHKIINRIHSLLTKSMWLFLFISFTSSFNNRSTETSYKLLNNIKLSWSG